MPTGDAASAVLVLAGGCFWGVQGVFQHTTGVSEALSGYAGGAEKTASYHMVGYGDTGHAESVRVTYDPKVIKFGKLLQIFFSVAHDPTQLDRQGPDEGPQYRSAIFPVNAAQADVAKAYIAQLNKARVFADTIVTKIETDKPFYRAEKEHQDFMTLYPDSPYIAENDLPKITELKKFFPEEFRATPVLIGRAS